MWKFLLDLEEDKALLDDVAEKFVKIMEEIAAPVLIVVGAFATAYVVYLGVMYAKAEDTGKRKEIQKRLIGMIIALVLLAMVLTVVLMIDWRNVAENWHKDGASWFFAI
jgi:NADH:ubiquinone oxidoreductase subunit 6 (subunit J)